VSVVTLEDVDRQINNNLPKIRFGARVEQLFVEEYARRRARLAPLWAVIGLLMYLFMLNDDYNLTPDVFSSLLFARLAIFTPAALLGTWAVRKWPTALNYDLLCLWVGVVGCLLPMAIVTQSHSDNLFVYQNGNVAAFMYFVIVLRPRFLVAILGLVLMTLIHLATMAMVTSFSDVAYSSIVSFVVTVAVFLAAGAYFLEHMDRMNFLHRLRGSLLHVQLEQMSERDEMTGLLNRRSLTKKTGQIWDDAGISVDIAAIMLDIDHFKRFNDAQGHVEGDACIRSVSRIVAETVGEAGFVYRFGGEEFIVLVPGATAIVVGQMAERIRRSVERLAIAHQSLGGAGVVTISLGFAADRTDACPFEVLVKRADEALYESKAAGRNRVSHFLKAADPHASGAGAAR